MQKLLGCLAVALTLGLPGSVGAETKIGDVVAGRALAEKTCVRCHDIEASGAFKTYPPSFAAIAAYRSPDLITERIWFPANHANMPQFQWVLERQEVADVTAYIASLDKAK